MSKNNIQKGFFIAVGVAFGSYSGSVSFNMQTIISHGIISISSSSWREMYFWVNASSYLGPGLCCLQNSRWVE